MTEQGENVHGTMLCAVTDTANGRTALAVATQLAERLSMRLVVAHVAEGYASAESLTGRQGHESAQRLLTRLLADVRLDTGVVPRFAVGDKAPLLARMAAEEAADLIVIGSRPSRRFGRDGRGSLARELSTATPIPVLIAPQGQAA